MLVFQAGGCLHNRQDIAAWQGPNSGAEMKPRLLGADGAGRGASLEHLTLEMLAYGRQKPAFSHFVARIFKKILAEPLAHFIR